MNSAEASAWLLEFKGYVTARQGSFGVFVDMRTLEPLATAAQKNFEEGQRLAREVGMTRSVVILDNPTLTYQFKRIALQSGIYDWERYIDASEDENWESTGLAWVAEGIDPDANLRERISSRREQIPK